MLFPQVYATDEIPYNTDAAKCEPARAWCIAHPGVANFLTRADFEGFEISAAHNAHAVISAEWKRIV